MTETIFININQLNGVVHCVSRRDGSLPLEGSLARHTGQEDAAVTANRDRVEQRFGPGRFWISPMQVHGDHVHVVDRLQNRGWEALEAELEADALVTNLPGVVLTILTADCVPILMVDPVHRAIGAVHAGWRGTRQKIVSKTLEKMASLYGSDPQDLIVGIGPAIGGCCYEVGAEVARHFTDYPGVLRKKGEEKYLLDTPQVNVLQLEAAGVPAAQIEWSGFCTSCDVERYFSYRAEGGTAGRFMSCIMLDAV